MRSVKILLTLSAVLLVAVVASAVPAAIPAALFGLAPGASLAFTFGTPITFNGSEAKELIVEEAFDTPEISEIFDTVTDAVSKTQIAFAGRVHKITKLDSGCGNGAETKTFPSSQKFWDFVNAKIWVKVCGDDLDGTLFDWARNQGLRRKDLTDTNYASFAMDLMTSAAKEDLLRLCWFGDTAIDDVGSGGTLGSAGDIPYYNLFNGFFKQIAAGVTAGTVTKIDIDENAETTEADQMALGNDTAYKVFRKMVEKADKRLIAQSDKRIYCTDSLFQNWLGYKESQSMDMSFVRQDKQYSTDIYRGVTIIAIPDWDRHIKSDFDNGTKLHLPHRAVFTSKKNLKVGIPGSVDNYTEFKAFYSEETELNHFKGNYQVDAKLIHEYLVTVAW